MHVEWEPRVVTACIFVYNKLEKKKEKKNDRNFSTNSGRDFNFTRLRRFRDENTARGTVAIFGIGFRYKCHVSDSGAAYTFEYTNGLCEECVYTPAITSYILIMVKHPRQIDPRKTSNSFPSRDFACEFKRFERPSDRPPSLLILTDNTARVRHRRYGKSKNSFSVEKKFWISSFGRLFDLYMFSV